MERTILYLGVAQIIADPTQPRKTFNPEKLEQMAASLKARGMLQPIRVCHDKERQAYRIVVGESRWRSARMAGLTEIPCIVMEGETPDEASLLADRLIENVCRSDLSPLELGRGISLLKRLRKCTSQDAAAELGLSSTRSAGRKRCFPCRPKSRSWSSLSRSHPASPMKSAGSRMRT